MEEKWKNISKKEMLNYFEDGLWYEEIGKIYNKASRTVRNKCSKLGIELERKNKAKKVNYKICIICGKKYIQSKNEGFCSSNCKERSNKTKNQIPIPENATEKGISIIKLRNKGLAYSEIAIELQVAKSTVAYWCNDTTKQKTLEKSKEAKKENPGKYKLQKGIDSFNRREQGSDKPEFCKDWNKKIRTAVSRFARTGEVRHYYQDVIEHLGGLDTKCYLTGDSINIEKDDFNLDHIIPKAKGGTNDLENLGITTPEANASKAYLTIEEYLELCKKVLRNFGYKIEKI